MYTPIHNIKGNFNENDVYIKREDLLPFSFGGNKVRIAQEFFADMESQGKNCMVGYGNSRSNLCRILSNYCASLDIPCYIISPADDNGVRYDTNNSVMSINCGANYIYCTKQNVAETVEKVLKACEDKGLKPYYIYGDKYGQGNKATATRAYKKVYIEIKNQEQELGIKFDYIFLAMGTGMTQSGLILGKTVSNGQEHIVGISVARNKETSTAALKEYLYSDNTNKIDLNDIEIDDSYVYGGYGQYGIPIVSEIKQMFSVNGIALDPTYTGKAFWGMKKYLKEKNIRNKKILFIHTGGTPLYFDLLKKGLDINNFIIKLEYNETDIAKARQFLKCYEKEFAVPISEKTDLNKYIRKILKYGYVFAAIDSQNNIEGIICGYANDFNTLQAFESSFVCSSRIRGSISAELLFKKQLEYCRHCGMKIITFSTDRRNIAAQHFYEKMHVAINQNQCTESLIQYKMYL